MDTDPRRTYAEQSANWASIKKDIRSIFDQYFVQTPLDPATVSSVVSVGCGDFLDAQVLSDFFPNANIVGYEGDPVQVRLAQRINSFPRQRVSIEQGYVGTGLLKPASADVIVVRNPDIHKETSWRLALQESIDALKSNGELIVTTLTEMEMDRVKRNIVGVKILVDEVHKKPGENLPSGVGDACVLIAEKI